jgi:excisionase family DNA binding protein
MLAQGFESFYICLMETFLSVEEFAKIAKISTQSAYSLIKNGQLPEAFRLGRLWRIPSTVFAKLREQASEQFKQKAT